MGPYPGMTVPMNIIVPVVGVAFAAFAVWLGLRIFNRHERWAKRTAIGLLAGLSLFYLLSFGPAVWLTARDWNFGRSFDGRTTFVESFYRPVLWSSARANSWLGKAVGWWGSLGVPDDKPVYLSIELDDGTVVLEFPESSE